LLLEAALARARLAGLKDAWERAANNLAILLQDADQYADALALLDELEAHARQRGSREVLAAARFNAILGLVELGHWQQAIARLDEADDLRASHWARSELVNTVPPLCEQGQLKRARTILDREEWQRDAEQKDQVASFAVAEARLLRAEARPEEALSAAMRGVNLRTSFSTTNSFVKRCLPEALEATLEIGDLQTANELLSLIDTLKPGEITPFLMAQQTRFRARLDARLGDHEHVESNYRAAEAGLAERHLVFHHAATQLEHVEWLYGQRRAEEARPLLDAAAETFKRLEAKPWLERLEAAATGDPAPLTA
jgi:tetratricopeptide (TPR) repeat protein